ncbi:uncharacterized protein IL334_007342 [Kwoniella shivajii]|uniref:Uncharacterized protein n=1 Tax=Kwoniella shivajii TaxID=564305 RepID=A0ABZ1D8E2_9TREE|nr:hypothetical protein IL334_007342 [Kwoniella shivajii]
MDDPWAAPTWSSSSKPTSSMIMPSPGRTTPPPRFDDSDPWGISQASETAVIVPTVTDQSLRNQPEVKEAPVWGGEDHASWGAESADRELADPQTKMEKAESEDNPVWGTNTNVQEEPPIPITPDHHIPSPSSLSPTSFKSPSPISAPSGPISPHKIPSPSFTHSPKFELPISSEDLPSSTLPSFTPIPKSPSFGDDFGGFATGSALNSSGNDPWGGSNDIAGPSTVTSKDNSGWGGEEISWSRSGPTDQSWGGEIENTYGHDVESPFKSILPEREEEEEEDAEGDDEGWGRGRLPPKIETRPQGNNDWEEAQRKIRIKQLRAPQEKIDQLAKAWTELLGSVIQSELEKRTGAEEMQFEEKVRKLEDDTIDRLRSLTNIPPDINTYPPSLTSLTTHERFVYALQRPIPSPSTSLLTTTVSRRSAQVDPLTFTSANQETSWTSRSMLGEPDAPTFDGSIQEEQNKSKWSFWGKRPVPERQLTTSGGGVLERKSVSSPDPSIERHISDVHLPSVSSSRAPSISVQPSRPSSPAPTPTLPSSTSHDSVGQAANSGPLPQSQPIQAGPSAVSRFFGRLSRNKPSATTSTQEVDAKDLELSADDFSFLSEVPSITQPPAEKGVGDLLALEPGRNEQIASLESLLNSKPAPLPKPLAPPPKGLSGSQAGAGKFVARMKSPPPNDMDLLGDLDFAGNITSAAQSPITQSPSTEIASHANNAWDDFLSLGSSSQTTNSVSRIISPSTPIAAAPLTAVRSGTPTVSLSPPPPVSSIMPNLSSTVNFEPKPSMPEKNGSLVTSDFGDIDDFGTPQHASISTFDDFGDFSAFQSTTSTSTVPVPLSSMSKPLPVLNQMPTKPAIASTPAPLSKSSSMSTPVNHARPGSLDHTPTINLLSGASASRGKRWPAPPSPIAPVLAPPPKPAQPHQVQAGFPFLSPPPPGRPNSRGSLLDGAEKSRTPKSHSNTTTNDLGPSSSSMFGGALEPSRSTTPNQMAPSLAVSPTLSSMNPQGKGGLSAQDLSFFDSL